MPFGIYIHIPYCMSKCRYCDFHSRGASRTVPDEYVQAVVRRLADFAPARPDTVYFGGGTPSLLTPQQLCRLIDAADPKQDAEITLEANPETVDLDTLQGFRTAGANRLSLGVQTAFDDSLRRLGRLHTAQQSRQALRLAHQAGFDNISGDIMLALPSYTTQEFDQTLRLMQEEGVSHISSYLLKIEPGTSFFRTPPENLPSEDEAADFYLYSVQQLEQAGYAQYEISNFALPQKESRHNLLYWNCDDYLGIGPAAHSCMQGVRYAFGRDTAAFIDGTASWEKTGVCNAEDYVMLQLRLNSGLDLHELSARYGLSLASKMPFLRQCVQHGLAKIEGERVSLTPQGMLVQNAILGQLLD